MIVAIVQQSYGLSQYTHKVFGEKSLVTETPSRRFYDLKYENGLTEYWVNPEAKISFCEIKGEEIPFVLHKEKILVYHSTLGLLDHIRASDLSTFDFVQKNRSSMEEAINNILAHGKMLAEENVKVDGRDSRLRLNYISESSAKKCAESKKDLTFAALWNESLKEKLTQYLVRAILHIHLI